MIRLSLVACLLLSVLAVSACGSGGDSATVSGAAGAVAKQRCTDQLAGLMQSLDTLRGHLIAAVGYRPYIHELEKVREQYGKVPVARLARACLAGPAAYAERSLDHYVRAANLWTRCVATSGCNPEAVRPAVDRQWWLAGLAISQAHAALPQLASAYRDGLPPPPR